MKCEICQRECDRTVSLSNHISHAHKNKITVKKYYDKYLKKENEGKCLECKKETTFISFGNYRKFCSTKCSNNNKEKQEKEKQTNQKNYGKNYSIQSEKIQEKYKQTCLKNFGVENPSQNFQIQEKKIQTSLKKYGTKHPSQTKEFQNKIKRTCLKKYGVKNWSKTDQGKLLHRKISIEQRQKQYNQGEPLVPAISDLERVSLDVLQLYLPIYNIKRNPRILNFFPDGWIEELKLDNEYDENDHKHQLKYDKDRDRQFYNAGCYVFRIKESEWLNDQQEVINKFLYLINYLEQLKNVNEINK